MAAILGAQATNAECLRVILDDPRTYSSRDGLLMALTLAVEYQQDGAAATLAEYIANPLTDEELLDLIRRLRAGTCAAPWTHNLNDQNAKHLRDLIEKAKGQYATCLRARDRRDIKIVWPYASNLKTITHSRENWLFLKALLKRRYAEHASHPDEEGAYRGFSVVLEEREFGRLCDMPSDWLLHCEENVSPMFYRTKDVPKPCSWEELYLKMAQQLEDIHRCRYSAAMAPGKGDDEKWFPFPNVVRKTNENAALPLDECYKRMDLLKDWDPALEPHKLFTRSRTYPMDEDRKDGRFPSHWSNEDNIRNDFYDMTSERPPHPATAPPCNYGLEFRKSRGPPAEYQCEATSPSSGSVAIASLSTVAGTIQQMKSFARKPSRGDAIPVIDEVEPADSQRDERTRPPAPPLAPISEVSNTPERDEPEPALEQQTLNNDQHQSDAGRNKEPRAPSNKSSFRIKRRTSLSSRKVARKPSLRSVAPQHQPQADDDGTDTVGFAAATAAPPTAATQDVFFKAVDHFSHHHHHHHHQNPPASLEPPPPPSTTAILASSPAIPIPDKPASRKDSGLGSLSPTATLTAFRSGRQSLEAHPYEARAA